MRAARLLVAALRDPTSVAPLDAAGWTALLTVARAERLIGTLAHRIDIHTAPPAAARILVDARDGAIVERRAAVWEAEMARRALAPLGMPVVLLKGTAFAVAGLDAGQGRSIGDLDILVPRSGLDEAEHALRNAGWEPVKQDAYDDAYYRRWMHELPPLIHRERDRMIDVHHTILPPTAKPTPNAAHLLSERKELNGGLSVLSSADMVIHAAAHLLADGDLSGGLRNLWDIDRLCREFAEDQSDFYLHLVEEAFFEELGPHLLQALRLAHHLFGTPIPAYREPRIDLTLTMTDHLVIRRLLGRDGWGRQRYPLTRFGFYIRSHALRMPPLMLARHLWTKAVHKRA